MSLSSIQMYLGPLRLLRLGVLFLLIPYGLMFFKSSLVRWSNLTATWPTKGVAVFFLIAVGSGVFGLSLGTTAKLITDIYMVNLALFVLLVLAIRDARDLSLLMWSYAIGVGLVTVLAFTVLDVDMTREGLARLNGGMGMFDANDLGMICLMGLPLAVLFFYNSGRVGKAICLGLVMGIPATIALTGSRGAMVGLAIVGPAMFFTLRRIALAKRVAFGVVALGALFAAAPAGYWEQMGTILDPSEDYNVASEYGRIPLAKRGVGYMLRYPFFGVGAGNFARAEGTISPIIESRLSRGLSVEWIAPHNTYAEVGAELGVVALIIWLSFLYTGTIGLWKLRRRIPVAWEKQSPERRFLREACLFLPLTFLAFASTSFFLSHAYTVVPYMLIAFLVGLLILVDRELKADRMRPVWAAPAMFQRWGNGVPTTQ